jgi:F0F1-type ATP synthase assembly protein I
MARLKRNRDRIIDPRGRRRLTRNEKMGVASVAALVGVALVGVIAGVLLDRLLDFDDALDAGGEWDEGGGVFTRWD